MRVLDSKYICTKITSIAYYPQSIYNSCTFALRVAWVCVVYSILFFFHKLHFRMCSWWCMCMRNVIRMCAASNPNSVLKWINFRSTLQSNLILFFILFFMFCFLFRLFSSSAVPFFFFAFLCMRAWSFMLQRYSRKRARQIRAHWIPLQRDMLFHFSCHKYMQQCVARNLFYLELMLLLDLGLLSTSSIKWLH